MADKKMTLAELREQRPGLSPKGGAPKPEKAAKTVKVGAAAEGVPSNENPVEPKKKAPAKSKKAPAKAKKVEEEAADSA